MLLFKLSKRGSHLWEVEFILADDALIFFVFII